MMSTKLGLKYLREVAVMLALTPVILLVLLQNNIPFPIFIDKAGYQFTDINSTHTNVTFQFNGIVVENKNFFRAFDILSQRMHIRYISGSNKTQRFPVAFRFFGNLYESYIPLPTYQGPRATHSWNLTSTTTLRQYIFDPKIELEKFKNRNCYLYISLRIVYKYRILFWKTSTLREVWYYAEMNYNSTTDHDHDDDQLFATGVPFNLMLNMTAAFFFPWGA